MVGKASKCVQSGTLVAEQSLNKLEACLKCLSIGHILKDCKKQISCSVCSKAHATALHREGQRSSQEGQKTTVATRDEENAFFSDFVFLFLLFVCSSFLSFAFSCIFFICFFPEPNVRVFFVLLQIFYFV